jgi:hypothetical protein
MDIANSENLFLIAAWSGAFSGLYILLLNILPSLKSEDKNKDEPKSQFLINANYASHFTSLAHAVISFIWALKIFYTSGLTTDRENNASEISLVLFSIGYFLMDTIFGLLFAYNDKSTNIHHFAVVSSLFYVVLKGKYANAVVCALGVAECSNPFLILRKIVTSHKETQKWAFPTGLIFAFSFLYTRYFKKHIPHQQTSLCSAAE